MYRNRQRKVVLRAGLLAQIKHSKMRVSRDTRNHVRMVRTELRRVYARMHRQREQALFPLRIPDLNRAIPTARQESILIHQIPVHREHFSSMLLPARYRELAHTNVEQLYASISAGREELVLVLFRPGQVEEAVLGFEELLAYDSVGGEVEDEESAIADEAEIGARAYGEA